MAGASLFALIDDIATMLDDVAVLTKVAAQKTAGVLGDDLALNAQQVAGVAAERELPVVWAVAQGSMVNKAILVPAALAISSATPWAVTPLLMLGGTYLCFEGVEKLFHKFFHAKEDADHRQEIMDVVSNPDIDLMAFEKEKVKGAIRTDFVLSAEIIVIALGTVAGKPFTSQLAVLAGVSFLMTVGVYGFVAGIVKLDDIGLWLANRAKSSKPIRMVGLGLLRGAPLLMKTLSVLGTAAMFLVGGGILAHGIAPLHHWNQTQHSLLQMMINGLTGIVGGVASLALFNSVSAIWSRARK